MTSTVTFGLIDGYSKVGNKVIVFLFSPINKNLNKTLAANTTPKSI